MKNFDVKCQGARNMWKTPGNCVTLYSGGCECFYFKKQIIGITLHLWLFGFQIFEFVIKRKDCSL